MYLSVYSCPLTVWKVSGSVQLSSHRVECICQCTVVLSLCGMYLSLYSCPVTFVSVQLHVPGEPRRVQLRKATTADDFGVLTRIWHD